MSDARTERATRFYGWLLKSLPQEFRDEAGLAMREVFAESYRDALRSGLWPRAELWASTVWDLLWTAWKVRAASPGRRKGGTMQGLPQDLKYGLRSLAKTPAFSLIAVLTLALGIGANTTIFTLVNALFFEEPPLVREPQRLVRIVRTRGGDMADALSYPDVLHYRQHNSVFEGLMAFDPNGLDLTVRAGQGLMAAHGWFVTDNYFDLLGVQPALGRWFLEEENSTPATRNVAIISHGFWQRALGGQPLSDGLELTLNGHSFTVVGIAPEGFRGSSPLQSMPDMWLPIMSQPLLAPTDKPFPTQRVPGYSWSWLTAMARLKPGVTIEAARANLDAMAAFLAENYPEWNEGTGAMLSAQFRYHPRSEATLDSMSRVLLAAVAAVLLIACANIAILMLARSSSRTRDTGVRMALGAGRGRVMRQALLESFLLALAGGAVGILAAFWTAGLAAALLPFSLNLPARPDAAVMALAFGLAVVASVVAGISPALQASRLDAFSILRGDDRSAGGARLRSVLVAGQVALSLMLVCAAALFMRSLQTARSLDLGFESAGRLVLPVNLRNHGYTTEQGKLFIRQALERLRTLPGVDSASAAHMVPFQGVWTTGIAPASSDSSSSKPEPEVGCNTVASDYFANMEIPILRGRPLLESDTAEVPLAVVINQAMAQSFWPGEEALGKVIGSRDDPNWRFTVVGLAQDATYYELGEAAQPQAYLSLQQVYQPSVKFFVHSDRPVPDLIQATRQALLEVDSTLPIGQAFTLDSVFEGEIGRYRLIAALVSVFGVLALLLASVGLYGVQSFAVARRRREIGIRMALGASRRRVQGVVVGRALVQTAAGVVLGLAGALAASSWIESMLFKVHPRDPLTLIGVPLLLAAVAVLSSSLPARRASRIDPIEALRAE